MTVNSVECRVVSEARVLLAAGVLLMLLGIGGFAAGWSAELPFAVGIIAGGAFFAWRGFSFGTIRIDGHEVVIQGWKKLRIPLTEIDRFECREVHHGVARYQRRMAVVLHRDGTRTLLQPIHVPPRSDAVDRIIDKLNASLTATRI